MRVVILGSGRGSNAAAILEAQQAGKLGRARVVALSALTPILYFSPFPGCARSPAALTPLYCAAAGAGARA